MKFRAVAVMRKYFELEIEAENIDQAKQIAEDTEGSEFEDIDDSDWEIYDVVEKEQA